METTEITGQDTAEPVIETEQTVPAAEAVTAPAVETAAESAQVSWFRKHRTAVISTTAAMVVIAGLSIGAISYGNQVIDQAASSISTNIAAAGKAAPAEAPKPTRAAAAKPAAPKVITPGQTLTAQQASKIRRNFKGDLQAYQMADGSYVAVSASQPLPAAVSADIAASANAALTAAVAASSLNNPTPQEDAILHSVDTAQYETGRSVILLEPIQTSYLNSTHAPGSFWVPAQSDRAHANVAGPVQFASRDAALAAAQKFVSAQADPSSWDIIG